MASHYFAKIYIEILDDFKMGMMSDRLWRRTIEVILLAKEHDDSGHLPELNNIAYRLHINPEILEAELNDLAKLKIVQLLDGGWFVTNFEKWQSPVSDKERKRYQRERQKRKEYHSPVTEKSQDSHAIVTKRDTEKKREEKKREDIRPSPNGDTPPIYELPEDAEPFSDGNEKRQEMVTAISGVVRETCAIGVTDEKFNQAADAFLADGLTTDDVRNFSAWWSKQDDRPYTGKPWLKSLVQNIKESSAIGGDWEDWLSDAKDFRNSS